MGLFNLFKKQKHKPARKSAKERPPSPMMIKVENIEQKVESIEWLLATLLHDAPPAVEPEEQEQGEGWEPFVAYSPMIDALGQEITENDGEEMIDYAEHAITAEYAAEVAAIDNGAISE